MSFVSINAGLRRTLLVSSLVCACAFMIAACGSSGGDSRASGSSAGAQKLLTETFKGNHTVKSGTLHLSLGISPKGSTALTRPVTISFAGPFQSSGSETPESDFTLDASIEGEALKLGLVSAGGKGYITEGGIGYRLPHSNFKKLESGFGGLDGTKASSSGSAISKLGIDPLNWLNDPRIVGKATIGGVSTTEISSAVNVTAMVDDVLKVLDNASSLGISDTAKFPKKLSASERSSIKKALGHPRLLVWTGNSDHIIRRLTMFDHIRVTGALSSELGGLDGVAFKLSFGYGDVNKPQTVTAPTKLRPYSQFETKVDELIEVLGAVDGSGTGTTTTSGGAGAGATTSGSGSGADSKYTRCLAKADGNVGKMQKCEADLNG